VNLLDLYRSGFSLPFSGPTIEAQRALAEREQETARVHFLGVKSERMATPLATDFRGLFAGARTDRGWWLRQSTKHGARHRAEGRCEGCGLPDIVRNIVRPHDYHHLSQWGADPVHGDLYPIFGLEEARDIVYLCRPCHQRAHYDPKNSGQEHDIDRLNARRHKRKNEYESLLHAFVCRKPSPEPFYFGARPFGKGDKRKAFGNEPGRYLARIRASKWYATPWTPPPEAG
jgi:hypothetical protein